VTWWLRPGRDRQRVPLGPALRRISTGADSVALYLGWQGLPVHEPLAGLLAASTRGATPAIAELRAEFWSQIRAETESSLTARLRNRYPPLTGT
jgi:hypothetical protein